MATRRLVSIASVTQILGLLVIAIALYKSLRNEEYDPSGLIATGVSVMSATYLLPTDQIDNKLRDLTEPIDPNITDE